MGIVGEGGFG